MDFVTTRYTMLPLGGNGCILVIATGSGDKKGLLPLLPQNITLYRDKSKHAMYK